MNNEISNLSVKQIEVGIAMHITGKNVNPKISNCKFTAEGL